MPDYARMYARQDYLTPGAAQTVDIIAGSVRLENNPLLLEVASGKGAAAVALAGADACRIVCIEPHAAFVRHSRHAIERVGLADRVRVVQADGRRLPIRDNVMTGAYCIGAPSIVGLGAALGEMARVVAPGGWVIASDAIWRTQPGPLGPEWRWMAGASQTTTDEYVAAITSAGLRVGRVTVHGWDAWEGYWRPLLAVAQEARGGSDVDLSFADDIEQSISVERRAVAAWLDYATFVASKPG